MSGKVTAGQRATLMLAAATAATYALLLWTGLTRLVPETGGLMPFDLRLFGYGVPEAEAYLAALTAEGRAALLGPIRLLDTAFPLLLGALLAVLIWRNGRRWLAAVPFGYAAVDLWENATISGIVMRNAPEMADTASNLTQGKYALLVLSLALVWMSWRGRAA